MRKGLTLIELMIMIAIVGIILAEIICHVRDATGKEACRRNHYSKECQSYQVNHPEDFPKAPVMVPGAIVETITIDGHIYKREK